MSSQPLSFYNSVLTTVIRFQKISGEKPGFINMKQKDKRKINSKIKLKITLYRPTPPPHKGSVATVVTFRKNLWG